MRALILYRPATEQEGIAKDYLQEYHSRRPQKSLELMDMNTAAATNLAELYGIVRFPAILITADDGKLIQLWQDNPLPLIDEVSAYLV